MLSLGQRIRCQAIIIQITIQRTISNKSRTQNTHIDGSFSWHLTFYQTILTPKLSFGLEYEDKH